MGLLLMLLAQRQLPMFFRRQREVALPMSMTPDPRA
jgi:hypothetical protein